ncbi:MULTISPECIES: ABC transporter permease [unclassified Spirosoma]|uniref:ABC transporter permease n=1 Tax=unclassified Spirosoma TaxID=2621999 RepID=UPI000967DCC6|nr:MULTISPECIES: ABC transporter permease [unclassified Spirosoma]MBN8823305.1 ABC transporter permease [Spirosoma sp.]OJW72552.1 MAG: ABC transporter permease [Spirosoma sp. 48-14]
MLTNYLKIALRNLLRSKGFSVINIVGLSIGMASAILIILWIQHELSYDQFHEKKDRIYEAWNRSIFSNKLECWNTTPRVLAKTMTRDFPEVERTARVDWTQDMLFTVGDKRLVAKGNVVDSTFLSMFSFPLLRGNPQTVLNGANTLVVTEKLAQKLFGNADPMGRTVKLNNKDLFTVTGVLKDLPTNTRFNFEYLLSWAYNRQNGNDDEYWGNNSTQTYVELKPKATLASIEPKLKLLRKRYDKDDPKGEVFLYPMSRWRLYSSFTHGVENGGLIDFVKLFGLIAVFILLIACINFMNLSTARSEKRAKEVGIRKASGAQRGSLIAQFLGESILIAFLAGIAALGIVQASLPAFNTLTDKLLSVPYNQLYAWFFFGGFVLLSGLLAGSYPAFFLSSFKPVNVLKGHFRKVNALITPRKVLVVLQFTFAVMLIISTIIVREQIQYARDRSMGYAKDNLIYHSLSGDIGKNYELIKNELMTSQVAVSISKTSAPLTQGWSNSWGFQWAGKAQNDKTIIDRFGADDNLIKTTGLQLAQGRDFDLKQYPSDSTAMILNESAVKLMGFKQPIGQVVQDNGRDWHVVGVIKDFILQSPYFPTKPMAIEGSKGWLSIMHIKLNPANSTEQNLRKAEAIFKKYNPEYPFDYKFIDQEYAQKFDNEQRIATLSGLFAGLTILISCLGLIGLATFTAQQRTKEIGIRKVLGASILSVVALLSKDFVRLVIISILIASPIAWYAMDKWLADYEYKVQIQWWMFVLAGLLAVGIALLTVSFQSIKAALINPAKSLKTE